MLRTIYKAVLKGGGGVTTRLQEGRSAGVQECERARDAMATLGIRQADETG